jgi:hypothetical protein
MYSYSSSNICESVFSLQTFFLLKSSHPHLCKESLLVQLPYWLLPVKKFHCTPDFQRACVRTELSGSFLLHEACRRVYHYIATSLKFKFHFYLKILVAYINKLFLQSKMLHLKKKQVSSFFFGGIGV